MIWDDGAELRKRCPTLGDGTVALTCMIELAVLGVGRLACRTLYRMSRGLESSRTEL